MSVYPEYESCTICPRACGVNRTAGQIGACGAADEVRIARAALHHWEEPLISGVSGSGTIFFTNCNLGCVYCQNAQISRRLIAADSPQLTKASNAAGSPSATIDSLVAKSRSTDATSRTDATCRTDAISQDLPKKITDAFDIARSMLDLQEQGALNINFVTPTHFAPTLRQAVKIARDGGLHLPIVWNTSGYETIEAIRENSEIVDVYLTDFKYSSEELARDLSGAADYPEHALVAIAEMLAQTPQKRDIYNGQERLAKGVIVRHLVLPGQVQNSIAALHELSANFGDTIMLSIMNQYTPTIVKAAKSRNASAIRTLEKYPELSRPVTDDEYEEVLCAADELFEQTYFYQDGQTCSESFIPDFAIE